MDLVRNSVKIEGRIASEPVRNVFKPEDDPIDTFVRKVFRFAAAATGKYLNQATTDVFVFLAGFVRIRVEPSQKGCEGFLS
jgi:hypothetical protein